MIPRRDYVSFRAFFVVWAEFQHWEVPAFHLRMCDWLEHRGPEGVLEVFRGAAKSTILAIYQAWRYRYDRTHRIIDRSADDATAGKLTADTEHVLRMHPLCRATRDHPMPFLPNKVGTKRFSVIGNPDKRNASLTAYGVLSNATSSRADEIINDDVEVPSNITPDKRATLLQRLQEEIHIIVPGGRILYVGTPHTHDSIYDDKRKNGYDALIIPMFSHYVRHEVISGRTEYAFDFPAADENELYVMIGIGRGAKVLGPQEYELTRTDRGGHIRTYQTYAEGTTIDIAAGNVWPQRFDRAEIARKRKECRTFNAWDSQYQLIAKPVHEVRLDPERLIVYDGRPEIRMANESIAMMLDGISLTGCRVCWDCSKGNKDSDDSAFAVIFQDEWGHMYWHILDILPGEVFEQANAVADRVVEYQIPSVGIKITGLGGFLPPILRKTFAERGIQCGVLDIPEKENKTNRILNAFEPALSGQFLHVHSSVYEALAPQMRDWIPSKINQPDDLLDAGEGCINSLPVKIGKVVKLAAETQPRKEWRRFADSKYEVKVEY